MDSATTPTSATLPGKRKRKEVSYKDTAEDGDAVGDNGASRAEDSHDGDESINFHPAPVSFYDSRC